MDEFPHERDNILWLSSALFKYVNHIVANVVVRI
jgi:hypothetical protein